MTINPEEVEDTGKKWWEVLPNIGFHRRLHLKHPRVELPKVERKPFSYIGKGEEFEILNAGFYNFGEQTTFGVRYRIGKGNEAKIRMKHFSSDAVVENIRVVPYLEVLKRKNSMESLDDFTDNAYGAGWMVDVAELIEADVVLKGEKYKGVHIASYSLMRLPPDATGPIVDANELVKDLTGFYLQEFWTDEDIKMLYRMGRACEGSIGYETKILLAERIPDLQTFKPEKDFISQALADYVDKRKRYSMLTSHSPESREIVGLEQAIKGIEPIVMDLIRSSDRQVDKVLAA